MDLAQHHHYRVWRFHLRQRGCRGFAAPVCSVAGDTMQGRGRRREQRFYFRLGGGCHRPARIRSLDGPSDRFDDDLSLPHEGRCEQGKQEQEGDGSFDGGESSIRFKCRCARACCLLFSCCVSPSSSSGLLHHQAGPALLHARALQQDQPEALPRDDRPFQLHRLQLLHSADGAGRSQHVELDGWPLRRLSRLVRHPLQGGEQDAQETIRRGPVHRCGYRSCHG